MGPTPPDDLAHLPLGTATEERARAQRWCQVAAQRIEDAEYWRQRCLTLHRRTISYSSSTSFAEQLCAGDQVECLVSEGLFTATIVAMSGTVLVVRSDIDGSRMGIHAADVLRVLR